MLQVRTQRTQTRLTEDRRVAQTGHSAGWDGGHTGAQIHGTEGTGHSHGQDAGPKPGRRGASGGAGAGLLELAGGAETVWAPSALSSQAQGQQEDTQNTKSGVSHPSALCPPGPRQCHSLSPSHGASRSHWPEVSKASSIPAAQWARKKGEAGRGADDLPSRRGAGDASQARGVGGGGHPSQSEGPVAVAGAGAGGRAGGAPSPRCQTSQPTS